jgi:hypothetical protein
MSSAFRRKEAVPPAEACMDTRYMVFDVRSITGVDVTPS